jgi:hypothetical protein
MQRDTTENFKAGHPRQWLRADLAAILLIGALLAESDRHRMLTA